MSGWEVWSTNNKALDVMFPFVRELHIENCPELTDLSLEALPLLRVLNIYKYGDGVLRSLVRAASSITRLGVKFISGLTDEVWRGVIKYLGAVEEVSMFYCNEIRYLWVSEAEASTIFVNLKSLCVSYCDTLISLGEKEEKINSGRNLVSSLRTLSIDHCVSMKHCCCPNSIDSLSIKYCSSLTSVSFPRTGGGGQIKSLVIENCEKLTERINTSMPMLVKVKIEGWRNLKSIVQLSSFIHLSSLSIDDCPSFESFPDTQLPNLTHMDMQTCQSVKSFSNIQLPRLAHLLIDDCESLESLPELLNLTFLIELSITRCPSMDTSCGVWPPNLRYLQLGGLKTPISEWGTQNFPTSLVDLSIHCEPRVRSFIQLSGLFPSSLTTLVINQFDNLKSLSMGNQLPTSLQHLRIYDCPKLKHLPKVLLPSLLSLEITECPNLSRRCNGRCSRYWPLISYIPSAHIC
ncbi:putative disease resistance protein At3g14460 [Bidens hawaiensis]|uniref:putative disease resistance protein At3g14460 n=1 Tax=Bidens hawaiensis TaxID=980011 RepID=UPI00404AC1D3